MSKITRKSYKRKKIIMGAVLFGGIGLVSTGFAAWVLSSSVQHSEQASLSVGTVDDKNMEFDGVTVKTTGTNTENHTYYFEPTLEDTTGRVRWDGVNSELLSLTVSGEILHTQNLGNITAKLTTEATGTTITADQAKANLDLAISRGYIVAPVYYKSTETTLWTKTSGVDEAVSTLVTVGSDTVIDASNDKDMKRAFTVEVKFAWGERFGGINPSDYYDNDDAGKLVPQGSKGDTFDDGTVAGYLDDMHTLLDTIQVKLTLTANPS